ncbi:MAG: STAS/SEC14 domain-containing protein [Bacteroidetes bacterium]|nr:STAS/SEC14 domain-containing protein [Bacteroidota bacterium]
MINSKFDKAEGILFVEFVGEITADELNNYIVSVRENTELPNKLKILSDASNGKFAKKVGRKELLNFLEENKVTLSQKEAIHDAFVVSNAFEMALGMLYREFNKINNYKFNVFSTKEAALSWLHRIP